MQRKEAFGGTSQQKQAKPVSRVRERSVRSVPMGGAQSRASRSSLSAGTPDSLSDNDASRSATPARKTSAGRPAVTPGGSRPSSRPASRGGSKPPSRHGSNLSLDSTDDGTPSRIPLRKVTTARSGNTTPRTAASGSAKLGVGFVSNGNASSRPRTPTGLRSPASGKSGSFVATGVTGSGRSRIPVPATAVSNHATNHNRPSSGTTTPSAGLARKPSNSSEAAGRRTPQPPADRREPFRL